ncbi:MAG: ATP-binding protein [Candidatus Rhabdochlamydia sp.]
MCHRDYTLPGGAVAIAMYDDRLEIINPGILPFDMTPEKLTRPHESKPWNPIIASVFYRAGVIEKWGTGTLNIIEWCKESGNPEPEWKVRTQSVVTTFLPSIFFSTGKGPQEQELEAKESRPESLEIEVLNFLQKGPLSKAEISRFLGHKQISGGLKKALCNLLQQGIITYTIPEKSNSRLQKYKLKNAQN